MNLCRTVLVVLMLSPSLVWAEGVPTFDMAGFIEATKERKQTIKIWIEEKRQNYAWAEEKYRDAIEIKELYEQGKQLQEEYDSLNGDFLKGLIMDDPKSRRDRRRIERKLAALKESYVNTEELAEEFDIPLKNAREYATSLAYLGAAETQLERSDDLITEGETLTEVIDDDPENKAALDLTNRNLNKLQTDLAEQGKTTSLILALQAERDLQILLRRASDDRMCE